VSKECHPHNVVQRECTKRCPVRDVHKTSKSESMMTSMIYVKSSKTNPSPLRLTPPSPRETDLRHATANAASSRLYGAPVHVGVSQLPLQMARRNRDTKATIHHVELCARGQSRPKPVRATTYRHRYRIRHVRSYDTSPHGIVIRTR
jgi:hypothetical protein